MKKAFIVVGHASFGKTEVMKALKGRENVRKSYIYINKICYWTRTRSNDDIKEELLISLKGIGANNPCSLIIVLCPVFDKNDPRDATLILEFLEKNYKLYFFILKNKFDGSAQITKEELSNLKKYGIVEICEPNDRETRAELLKKYIIGNT
jgi:hypothetical protein